MGSKKLKLTVRVTVEQRDMIEKMRIAAGKKSLEDYMRCSALSGSSYQLLSEVGRNIGECASLLSQIAARADTENDISPAQLDKLIGAFVAIVSLLRKRLRFAE